MGLPWYGALLVPVWTRDFLLYDLTDRSDLSLAFWRVESIILLCLTSFVVAVTCRRWIVNAKGWQNLLLGAVLPFYGSALFLVSIGLVELVGDMIRGGLYLGFLGKLYMIVSFGLMYAAMAAYVVIPMGCFSQVVMRWVGRRET
jgi:hypothetical protein